jgi:hypothetical protein
MHRTRGSVGRPVLGLGLIGEISFRRRWVFSGRSRGGAEAIELVKRAVEGAFDAGFVTRKGFDGAGTGSVIRKSARTGIKIGRVFVPGQLRHTDAEQTGFEGAHAAQAPGGHGHLLDKQGFGGSGGLVFGEKGVEQFLKLFRVLVGEDGGLGGEAVTERVEADGGATFGSARAGAELSVATISVDLALGEHKF